MQFHECLIFKYSQCSEILFLKIDPRETIFSMILWLLLLIRTNWCLCLAFIVFWWCSTNQENNAKKIKNSSIRRKIHAFDKINIYLVTLICKNPCYYSCCLVATGNGMHPTQILIFWPIWWRNFWDTYANALWWSGWVSWLMLETS